ncbi:hypothetical protein MHU86_10347 [Fragilaria crotonensis]|nr:hypothetical protein MHU86_10347 [Fragilaria crotonensis]
MHITIGPEDGSLADRLVAAVNVAADDTAGDGLSGRNDNDVYPMDDESRKLFALSTSDKRSVITPEILSRRWGVGLDTAKRTLKVTTQSGIRNVLAKGERKVRQKLDHLAFPNLSVLNINVSRAWSWSARIDHQNRSLIVLIQDRRPGLFVIQLMEDGPQVLGDLGGLTAAINSASVELVETVDWTFDLYAIGPPQSMKARPVIERRAEIRGMSSVNVTGEGGGRLRLREVGQRSVGHQDDEVSNWEGIDRSRTPKISPQSFVMRRYRARRRKESK